MIEYVLVSQGIECDRSINPYQTVTEAIKGNKEWYKYCEKCADEYERPADNEMFVYQEKDGEASKIDIDMCETLISEAEESILNEFLEWSRANIVGQYERFVIACKVKEFVKQRGAKK